MKAIVDLNVGDKITPRFPISSGTVKHWKYASDCPSNFAPIDPGSGLTVFEKSTALGNQWVKVYVPHTHKTLSLKIAGGELSSQFRLII